MKTTSLASILLIYIFVITCSCQNNSINEGENIRLVKKFKFQDFKSTGWLKFYKTGLNFGNSISTIGIVDTVLIVCNYRDSNLIEVIGLKSMATLARLIKRGKQADRCLTISDIISTSDKKISWLYDVILGKFIEININDLLANPQEYHSKTFFTVRNNCRGIKSPTWISSNRFASCTYRLRIPRYIEFDSSSHILRTIGKLPEPIPGWPPENETGPFGLISCCYSAILKKHPLRNEVVVAYTTADRLEFYQGNKLIKILSGPGRIFPVYSFRNDDGINLPVNTNATVMTNVAVATTSRYIFTLYSGRGDFGFSGQEILAFDWSGRMIKRFKLGINGASFCIKENSVDKMTIYIIDEKTGDLLQSSVSMNQN